MALPPGALNLLRKAAINVAHGTTVQQGVLPLEFAPSDLRSCGLAAAHPFPLVGDRRHDDNTIFSWRTTPDRAWSNPLVEWSRAGSSYAALVLDVDDREAVERIHACSMGAGPVPPPNVTMTRRESGHVHAGWILGTPVHRSAAAREKPLRLFGRVAEYFTVSVGADRGYAGVLCANPSHADYETAFPRQRAYELRDLAAPIPAGWRVPAKPASEPGRNCLLFRECLAWALRITDDGLMAWALTRGLGMHPAMERPEIEGIVRSVCRYRARWRMQGHQPSFLFKQAARGRKGGGKPRAASVRDDVSNETLRPWDDEGVSRRMWYYRRARGLH